MAVVKKVLTAVQEWMGEENLHPYAQQERTIEEARFRAQMLRRMYL